MESCARAAALIAGFFGNSRPEPSELAGLLFTPRPTYMSIALRVFREEDGSPAGGGGGSGTTGAGGAFAACTSNLLSSPICTFSLHSLHDTFVGRVISGRRAALARATATGR